MKRPEQTIEAGEGAESEPKKSPAGGLAQRGSSHLTAANNEATVPQHGADRQSSDATAELVAKSMERIEQLCASNARAREAEASLETVRRVLRQAEAQGSRCQDGQACWCELDGAGWEEEHEPACRAVRLLVRRIWGAMGGEDRR